MSALDTRYFVCADCGHIEPRPEHDDIPFRCENCGCNAAWIHDDLDSAEGQSQSILDYAGAR